MKSRIIFAILFLTFTNAISSQNLLPCDTGNESLCKCSTAPILTSEQLNMGVEFDMSSFQHASDGPSPMCPPPLGINTASTNPSWVSFIAKAKSMTINLINSNCTIPNASSLGGVQLAVYGGCPASTANAVFCNTQVSACNGNGTRNLFLDNLTIGNQYYILIDGCTNSACHIKLQSAYCKANTNIGKKNIVKIGGVLWSELDKNMVYDKGDEGMRNYSLNLHNELGEIIDSAKTDDNGNYLFSGSEEGCYYISMESKKLPFDIYNVESCGEFKNESGIDNDNNLIKLDQPVFLKVLYSLLYIRMICQILLLIKRQIFA